MRGYLCLVFLACLISGLAMPQTRIGGALLSLPMSARQDGMGEVSIGGSDVLRGWSNPAILAVQETKWEFAAGGASLFGEQTGMGLGAGYVFNPSWTFGGYIASSGIQDDEIDAFGEKTAKKISHSSMVLGLAGAWKVQNYAVGLMLGGISESVGVSSGSALSLGLGGTASFGDIGVGASFRNLGLGTYMKAGDETTKIPTELRAGASYLFNQFGISVGAEYSSVLSIDSTVGLGVEWWYQRILALRTGLMKNMVDSTGAMNITAGLSVLYRGMALDYALSTHEIGMSNRVALSYALGAKRNDVKKEVSVSPAEVVRPVEVERKVDTGDAANLLYQEAVTAYNSGDYSTAIARAEAAVQANPGLWQAWQVDGNARLALGDKTGALTVYKYALGIEPNNPSLASYVEQLEKAPQ